MYKNALNFFETLTKKDVIEPETVKLSKSNNFSAYDRKFVTSYLHSDMDWLDMGAGTGLLINELHQKVKRIVAVEPFKEFSDLIVKAENIRVINENHAGYAQKYPDDRFDLITCFGVIQYLNSQEALDFYKRIFPFLKKQGKIIIKNQYGVQEDVIINKFSDELQTTYYSEYRTLEHEKKLMSGAGFKNFEIVDIYPPECSRWNNTHFYAIVAEK